MYYSMSARTAIISPDWDFKKMGIGGLAEVSTITLVAPPLTPPPPQEFSVIFRRAFASRVFPAEVVASLGELLCCHGYHTAVLLQV